MLRDFHSDNVVADLFLSDRSGRIIAEMVGLCLRKLLRAAVTQRSELDLRLSQSGEPREPLTPGKATPSGISRPMFEGLAGVSAQDEGARALAYLQHQGADLSGFPESNFHPDSCLVALGFDSLMAIMLANRIKSDLDLTLPIGRLLSNSTIQALGDELHHQWLAKNTQERTK